MIDWIKSHWLFCVFAGVVLILVIIFICVLAHQSKKEKELDGKSKKLVAVKRSNLEKKQEENLKVSKPIIKENLRTGEKVKRNIKIKEQPNDEQSLENEEIKKEEPKKEAKKQPEVKETKKKKEPSLKESEKVDDKKVKEEKEQMKKEEKKPVKKAETKKVEEKKQVKQVEPKKVEEKKESETYRVVYDKEQKNWIVKIDGGERASRRCATKEEALKVAKDLAKKKDADLSVHKKNGKFQKQ